MLITSDFFGCLSLSVASAQSTQEFSLLREKVRHLTVAIKSVDLNLPENINPDSINPIHGSGVLIKKNNQIYTVLTNCHIFEYPGTYSLTLSDSATHLVQIPDKNTICAPGTIDLAMLIFESDQNYPVAQINTNIGYEKIWTAGYPQSENIRGGSIFEMHPQGGNILDLDAPDIPSYQGYTGYTIIHDAESRGGMSGSGIWSQAGELVAITGLSKLDGFPGVRRSFAIPINDYQNWIEEDQDQVDAQAMSKAVTVVFIEEINNDWSMDSQLQRIGQGIIFATNIEDNTYNILTNCHVVSPIEERRRIYVYFSGQIYGTSSQICHPEVDLAIVKINLTDNSEPNNLINSELKFKRASLAQKIVSFAYPLDFSNKLSIISIEKSFEGQIVNLIADANEGYSIYINPEIKEGIEKYIGISGSGIFSETGELVRIVGQVNGEGAIYAIPISEYQDWLSEIIN